MVDLLLASDAAPRIRERVFQADEVLHAPALLDLEVTQVLRRECMRGEVRLLRATEALNVYRGLDIRRHFHHRLLGRIWDLRHNLTAYDSAYLALAESLNAPLLTRDAGLARIGRRTAAVELI